MEMKIQEIFAKPIDRNIKGVITIGDEQDSNVKQELEEYVVTRELQDHFHDFFEAYVSSINHETTKMGVWISGFFGSGKSHFLKILAYLLENREVAGKPAINYFLDSQKLRNQQTIKDVELAASVHNETILFNIDSKAKNGNKSQKDAILNVFLQVFNEQLGLIGVDFWIADMERDLIRDGQYEAFQAKFQELDKRHRTWLDARNGFAFLKGTIKESLVAINYMTEENATGFIEQLKTAYPISVENFAQRVNAYIETQTPDYHLVFLVDEVGQYIGDSQQRMLNLQSVVEDLGTYTHGKAWVIVTSQQAIDQVTDNINGQDFSKIQGRFNTRIAMSSANVDEVINKRLLAKTATSSQMLATMYDNNQHAINNLMDFDSDIERDHYRSPENFAEVYPFVPYQFNLLQDTLTAIRENGSDGKHLANGERSMLAVFQESAQRLENKEIGGLVPFSLFFQGLEQFLDHTHIIVIKRAIDNDVINPEHEAHPFAVQVLETLFMVKYVDNFNATLNNIVTLMIDSINTDRIELESKVKTALQELTSQRIVEKTTKGYEFLTDAEQDISRQIGKQNVDSNEISQAIADYLFSSNQISRKFTYPKLSQQYNFTFNQFVDGHPHGLTNNSMSLKINTSESSTNRDTTELRRIALSPEDPQIIIDLPAKGQYIDDLREAMQIGKFVLSGTSQAQDARSEQIVDVKKTERQTLIQISHADLETALEDADIYVGSDCLEAGSKSFKQRLADAETQLVDDIYRNLSFITAIKTEKDIVSLFKDSQELVSTDENSQAVQAVLKRIISDSKNQARVSYKSILDRFVNAPYGYRDIDIKWIIAKLFVSGKAKAYVNGEQVNIVEGESANQLADYFVKKQYVEKLQIEPRIAVDEHKKTDLKEVAREVFQKTTFTNNEDDTLVKELRDHNVFNMQQTLASFLQHSNRYPGRDVLETGQRLMTQLLSRKDTDAFYNLISEKHDDLLDWHDDMDEFGIYDFYVSEPQQHIWDDSLAKLDIYRNSKEFIQGDKVPECYQQIDAIIKSNRPQGKVNELKQLNQVFNDAYSEEFDKVEANVEQVIRSEWDRTLDYVQSRASQLVSDVNGEFERLVKEAKQSVNLDSLVVIKEKANVVKTKYLTRADRIIAEQEQALERKKSLKKQQSQTSNQTGRDTSASANPDITEKAVQPTVKHISLNSLPVARTWQLDSAKDVDAQLAQLRIALLQQLEDADQIKVDL